MDATSLIGHWDNFYVIVGSSSAALTGLQFVVMTLATDTRVRSSTPETIDAFGTPQVVHFSMVLLESAILSAPWTSIVSAAATLAVCGIGGVVYECIIIRRTVRQKGYTPVLEDWIWHVMLPIASYAGLTAGSFALPRYTERALFAIAGSSLLLLFAGIHNAWDTVTYIATGQMDKPESGESSE